MTIGLTQHQQQSQVGIVGQQAPSWQVSEWYQLPTGVDSLDVKDYKGKVLYLYFFQSWCPGCHQSGFPTLKTLTEELSDFDDIAFAVIQTTFEGHAQNGPDQLEPTAARYNLKIPFAQSKGDSGTPEIMQRYRTGGTPWVAIIDKSGKVVFNDFHIDPTVALAVLRQLRIEPNESAAPNS